MPSDEEQIRQLVATWMAATKSRDAERVLELMTDDVVFLAAGQPPMDKNAFAAQAGAQAGSKAPAIDGSSTIDEIQVMGDWAFMRSRLTVVVTPADGSPPMERSGPTLSILRKEGGRWRLARDANLLAPVRR